MLVDTRRFAVLFGWTACTGAFDLWEFPFDFEPFGVFGFESIGTFDFEPISTLDLAALELRGFAFDLGRLTVDLGPLGVWGFVWGFGLLDGGGLAFETCWRADIARIAAKSNRELYHGEKDASKAVLCTNSIATLRAHVRMVLWFIDACQNVVQWRGSNMLYEDYIAYQLHLTNS